QLPFARKFCAPLDKHATLLQELRPIAQELGKIVPSALRLFADANKDVQSLSVPPRTCRPEQRAQKQEQAQFGCGSHNANRQGASMSDINSQVQPRKPSGC